MMRNMMQGSNPGVMAENARTLRNQGQPEDMALRLAAKQAAMGAAGGSAMGSLGAGGMQKEVMPGMDGDAMGALSGAMGAGGGSPHASAGAAMGGALGGWGGSKGMMPLPSDPNAAQGNAPAIAIPGAGNPLPPGMGDGGASGGSAPNDDPNAPQPEMSQWIQQLISRMHQGGSMGPGQAQGGMSTLAGMIGKR